LTKPGFEAAEGLTGFRGMTNDWVWETLCSRCVVEKGWFNPAATSGEISGSKAVANVPSSDSSP